MQVKVKGGQVETGKKDVRNSRKWLEYSSEKRLFNPKLHLAVFIL